MPNWTDIGNIWNTLREVDITAIHRQAETPYSLAIISRGGATVDALVRVLRTDPRTGRELLNPTIQTFTLPQQAPGRDVLLGVNLVLIIITGPGDHQAEQATASTLRADNIPLAIVYLAAPGVAPSLGANEGAGWGNAPVLQVNISDSASPQSDLATKVVELAGDQALSLARNVPLVREAYVRNLISQVSFQNATYAFTTGLSEIVPILDIPFNIADMIILTKNQAIMGYRIALAMGETGDWQDILTELGSVVGAGFIWRQVARQLVGLIPAWGILPKTAIAYAGTYVTGNAIYRWYMTGQKLNGQMLKSLYSEGLQRGRVLASQWLTNRKARLPLPANGERSKRRLLPFGKTKGS